ncbi:hypothetical protein NDU88_002546 [Pleurodeles waltl]|uniref:Uncharacterized protein n=1 Tax=Pleurodeles waltl TaxID=8319 RepID=A0AAV7LFY9_PLEWA|nr:hypothetical protein NDU88_002546 [Pleurodeles waltl]
MQWHWTNVFHKAIMEEISTPVLSRVLMVARSGDVSGALQQFAPPTQPAQCRWSQCSAARKHGYGTGASVTPQAEGATGRWFNLRSASGRSARLPDSPVTARERERV